MSEVRTTKEPAKKVRTPKEGRNLVILGVGATGIAFVTTAVSLFIYHASGDIYLDRSRPGFLPDESEVDELEAETSNYKYPDSGAIDKQSLEEYLAHLKDYQKDLTDLPNPYPESSLSDQALGLPADRATEEVPEETEEASPEADE